MIRTFVAFEISDIHRKECDYLLQKGKRIYQKEIKWVDSNNLHVTFLFLGDIMPEDKEKVTDLLSEFIYKKSDLILTDGVLNWNSISKPQTIWLEYKFNNPEFHSLRKEFIKKLKSELPYLNIDKRDFLCHVTLGRVKSKINIEKWQVYNESVTSGYVLNQMTFYQSTLHPSGPVYTPIFQGQII